MNFIESRDELDYTSNILNKIFTSNGLWEARQTINQSMISYDGLFNWIYKNLPVVLDEPHERLEALEKLARADVYKSRARQLVAIFWCGFFKTLIFIYPVLWAS